MRAVQSQTTKKNKVCCVGVRDKRLVTDSVTDRLLTILAATEGFNQFA